MPSRVLNLGPAPLIEVPACHGDLEVRGSSREETLIETGDQELAVTIQDGGALVDGINDSCVIRLPEQGHLRVARVHGNVHLKDVRGTVSVDRIDGSCSARRVGVMNIAHVEGEVRLRDTDQPVTLGRVQGHLTLRDVSAPITAERVDGHFFGSNIPAGVRIDRIEGNLVMRTPFHPESTYEFPYVEGRADLSVPEDASVRFVIEAEGKIQLDSGLHVVKEGSQHVITMGSGSASVRVVTGGRVRIRNWDYCCGSEEFPFAFDDFSAQLDDVFTQLDAHFSNFSPDLGDLPERVRGKVARKLDVARRRMEDAQRHVEKAVQRAQHDFSNVSWMGDAEIPLPRFARGSEPVSEQERLTILRMLEEGKITVADAEKLLSALEGN